MKQCVVCDKESEYNCPACSSGYCSSKCYKEHKLTCNTNIRHSFIPKDDIDEGVFMSDYSFIYSMNELIGGPPKQQYKHHQCKQGKGAYHQHLSKKYSNVYFACIKRWIRWFPATGPASLVDSKPAFYRLQDDKLLWKIEVVKDGESTYYNLPETEVVSTFADADFVYLKFNNSYKRVNTDKTIREALKHRYVLDHPVFVLSNTEIKESLPKIIYDPVLLEMDDNMDTESEE